MLTRSVWQPVRSLSNMPRSGSLLQWEFSYANGRDANAAYSRHGNPYCRSRKRGLSLGCVLGPSARVTAAAELPLTPYTVRAHIRTDPR
jgi:hypothetical protein